MTNTPNMFTEADFTRFKAAYPHRKGGNPWTVARKSFDRAISEGHKAETIIAGVLLYYAEQRDLNQINTPFVCQAATWLNQRRWLDYVDGTERPAIETVWVQRDSERWPLASARYRAEKGRLPPTVGGMNGSGWYFPAEWVAL